MIEAKQIEQVTPYDGNCPICSGSEVDPGPIELLELVATTDVECDECGAVWVDEYIISGFSDLKGANPSIESGQYKGACPACLSENVDAASIKIKDGTATSDVKCNECPATWVDVYSRRGYRDLQGKHIPWRVIKAVSLEVLDVLSQEEYKVNHHRINFKEIDGNWRVEFEKDGRTYLMKVNLTLKSIDRN